MDIHQLKLFLAVMESSSMTRAAEKIHLSPGAVSLQLHNLANELNTELFARSGKRLIPTQNAVWLAEHAKVVVKLMGNIEREFANDLTKDFRPFHFATGVTTLIYQMGGPLRQLRKSFPKANIYVTVSVTEETVVGLKDCRFDLGLITLPVADDGLNIIPLFEEELFVVQPSSTKVSGGRIRVIKAAELGKAPFILYPRSSNLRQIIDRLFERIHVTPRVVMEADDTEAIKRMVEAGFGYSVLPEHGLRGRTRYFQTYRVEGEHASRGLALAMLKTESPRKLTLAIAEFLQKALTQPKKELVSKAGTSG
jgi:DNA-binding transcriptional LysR family regulator